MKQIKYKNYSIDGRNFTVKFTYLPNGGFHYTPTIKYQIMEYHELPKTFFGRLTEMLKFGLDTNEWDPTLTDLFLETEVTNKLRKFKEQNFLADITWKSL